MSERYKDNMDNRSMDKNEASTSKISNSNENRSGSTIEHIPNKLHNCWIFWKISNNTTLPWEERLTQKTYFLSVEEFERKYNDLFPITNELRTDFDYAVFRLGIPPIWENECNRNVGKWIVIMHKSQGEGMLRYSWRRTCSFMIGEDFSRSEVIYGSVVNIRNTTDIIALWTANAHDKFTVLRIGRELKTLLACVSINTIIYRTYANSMSQDPKRIFKITHTI